MKNKSDFTIGQLVFYKRQETYIEKIFSNGDCLIANPEWNWDEEDLCTKTGLEYNVPYWIKVKPCKLKLKN